MQYPVYNTLSITIHILISITTITSTIISVMCFRTVNASGTIHIHSINAPFLLPKGRQL